jgi:hypothetical protein
MKAVNVPDLQQKSDSNPDWLLQHDIITCCHLVQFDIDIDAISQIKAEELALPIAHVM